MITCPSRLLMRCRRGSIAIITSILAMALLGFVALGSEAGRWYISKQETQNAADAAALAGVFDVMAGSTSTSNAVYFAKLNGYTDQAIPFAGAVQSVSVTTGHYGSGVFTTTTDSPNAVRAIVGVSIPPTFSAAMGFGNITVSSTSIAYSQVTASACILSLTSLSIGGNTLANGQGCYFMANTQALFNGSSATINVTGFDAAQGCVSSNGYCTSLPAIHNWYASPVINPLAGLGTFSPAEGGTNFNVNNTTVVNLPPYEANGNVAYGNIKISGGGVVNLSPGTYFMRSLSMTGGIIQCPTCTASTGVNIVILANAGGLSIGGNATVQLNAAWSNSTFPSLNSILFYDRETTSVTVSGTSNSYYGGVMYFPNAAVSWNGNAASTVKCSELIGYSVSLSGSTGSNFVTQSCPSSVVPKIRTPVSVQ